MRAHEFVKEAFDQPYPIRWQQSEHGDYDALATLDDGTYLSIMFNNEGNDEWQVEFHRNNSQEVTGEGDAQRVFATVLTAIQAFIKKEQPWRLIFSASKESNMNFTQSRANLYSRLVQRYARSWGYDEYEEDHGDQVTYELTKLKQPVAEDRGQGAAGIILYAADTGRYGLQQRSDNINDPGVWAAWGGGSEPGESPEQTARRELAEESGYTGPVKLHFLDSNPKYTTFIGVVPSEFEPRPCDEWKDYCWVELGKWPHPLHPGVAAALENVYIKENFADGKVKGKSRPGRVKRAGASCAGSVTDLRAKAKKYGGERGKMYHWCANMKGGKK